MAVERGLPAQLRILMLHVRLLSGMKNPRNNCLLEQRCTLSVDIMGLANPPRSPEFPEVHKGRSLLIWGQRRKIGCPPPPEMGGPQFRDHGLQFAGRLKTGQQFEHDGAALMSSMVAARFEAVRLAALKRQQPFRPIRPKVLTRNFDVSLPLQ